MRLGWRILLLLLASLAVVLSQLTGSTQNDATGKSSLTFVFDITGSMFDDLLQVREGASKIFRTVIAEREKLIYNYIMVPFHDPHLGDIINTTDSTFFMRQLSKVYVHGGGDCPEKTLTGILKALEISLPSSFIYVFTDARSKDYDLEDQVLNTIQEKQSSVVFVMTGDCGNRTHPGFRTYEKIAAASFGQVFHLEKSDVSTVLEYVKHAVEQKKVHLMYEARERGGIVSREIPVDIHMSELTLSLSGDKDDRENLDITLKDPTGRPVDKTVYSREGGTIDLKNVKLIRLKKPMPGIWTVITNSRLKHTIRVFGHGNIDFKYGFASRPLDRIELTRPRPVANQNTYLQVNVTGLIPPGQVAEISLLDYYGKTLYKSAATPHKTNPHMSYVGPFIPPTGLFFVQIRGTDEDDYEFIRIAPTAIGSVTVGGPRAFVPPKQLAFVGHATNMSCTVESATEYTLYWMKGNERLAGPLFYQMTDTSVWTMKDVSMKDAGDYSCVVISDNGNHTVRTNLDVREMPPQIVGMRNQSVPISTSAYLHCPVTTQSPSNEIRWIRHGSTVFNSPNHVLYSNGTLKIHKVARSDAGAYECQARNTGGMTTQGMILKIMEPPTAVVSPTLVYFVPEKPFNFSCAVSGDPPPDVHWYKNGRRVTMSREFFITYKYDLVMRHPSLSEAGEYTCQVQNAAGIASQTATATLAVSPLVAIQQNKKVISKEDHITFTCEILQGTPRPTIKWLRNGRELLLNSYQYITIRDNQLFVNGIQDSDGGSYSCFAENIAGQSVAVTQVVVGRPPSIVPTPATIYVNIERQATLQCHAIGSPTPNISWVKGDGIMSPERYNFLPDGTLIINNVQIEDEDRFTCTAQNEYGQQSMTVTLTVRGLISPKLGHVPPEEQLVEGRELRLSCVVVSGTPRPKIVWYKDGNVVQESSAVVIEGGGTSLLLREGRPADEGQYTCAAISPAGNATLNINVQLIKRPEFVDKADYDELRSTLPITPSDQILVPGVVGARVKEGDSIAIPCPVNGSSPMSIMWSLNGKPISINSKDFTITTGNVLLIHNAKNALSGEYTCTATNAAGESQQNTILDVVSKPVIAPGQTSYNLIKGNPVNIPCDVSGTNPEITWYRDGELFTEGVLEEDGSLTIDDVDQAHKGVFKCVAKTIGGTDERTVTLTVHTAPIVDGSGKTVEIKNIVNETVVLPCPARADPPPVRQWTFDGERIENLPIPHTIDENGSLVLNNVDLGIAGHFTCLVSNLAGDDSISYDLEIVDKPKIISETPGTLDIVKGLTLEIPCRATGTPEPERTWEKDGIPIDLTDSKRYSVDSAGTLRIQNTFKEDAGQYTCIVESNIGRDEKTSNVVIQEAPIILPTTISNYTAVVGDQVELRCHVKAHPPATIHWTRKGVLVTEKTPGVKIEEDGTLTIFEVSREDATFYTCKATNAAGKAEKNIRLSVIVAPEIPDQDVIGLESVRLEQPFSLYCPVFSTPLPTITWYVNEEPLPENDQNINLSDDKRRLHVYKARTKDAGVYKCTARNAAGEGSKTFDVEVIVPLNIDESKWKKKVIVKEGDEVVIGCPVSGLPEPKINWIIEGRIVNAEDVYDGAVVSNNGETVTYESVQPRHAGLLHCVAQNKAGTLDVDVELIVLAIPRLGEDESLEVIKGKAVTLSCDVSGVVDDKTTITWSVNGSEKIPSNVQVPMNGFRLFITNAEPNHSGNYVCLARNSAGESKKRINVTVLEPPEFVEQDYEESIRLVSGQPLTLNCHVTGNPKPTVEWRVDGQTIAKDTETNDDQTFHLESLTTPASHVTCVVSNKAGSIARDFFVTNIAPPKLSDSGFKTVVEVNQGDTIQLDCPVTGGEAEIKWTRQGSPMNEKDAIFTLDKSRLIIMNAQLQHEDVFTCIAENKAGVVTKDFDVIVFVAPSVKGDLIENIEAIEGSELQMECEGEGNPEPVATWKKDSVDVQEKSKLLNGNKTLVIADVVKDDGGVYRCVLTNPAGIATKTFNVHIIEKPDFFNSNTSEIKVNYKKPATLECAVSDAIDVEFSWTRHQLPIVSGVDNIQVLSGGRFLHIPSATVEDAGSYECIVKNKAGESTKKFQLHVQVPPFITNEGGEYTVIENNSLVLPCEVEGQPKPVITWTKDGRSLKDLKSVQVLSEGQQFKIVHAETEHRGSYVCQAKNEVGSSEITFDVDIITRPSVSKGIKEVIEVNEFETANFKCPIADKNFKGQIICATTADEGPYSCRIKNDAGETRVDFKLVVNMAPVIHILDKDKNRTVKEGNSVTLSCPVTGKPEPTIVWLKDGEEVTEENVATIIPSGQLARGELKILRVRPAETGRYTCEATNKAGSVEQDVLLTVMSPPKIEKEGIPSEFDQTTGQTITISCPVFAKPAAKITWLKSGRPLESNTNVKTSANGQKLYILKMSRDDADKYTCIAKNPAGEDKRDFVVNFLEAPSFEEPNLVRRIQVNKGKPSVLNCPAIGNPKPTITWLRDAITITADENHVFLDNGRQLQISNTRDEDQGRYTCFATNVVGTDDLETSLEVISAPEIDGPELEVHEVIENMKLDLFCQFNNSDPQTDVEWQKAGETINRNTLRGENYLQIPSSGKSVHILSVKKSDEGRYTCIVRNAAGEARKSYDVKVLVPPTFNEQLTSQAVQVFVPGNRAQLHCEALGDPIPVIEWKFNDKYVTEGLSSEGKVISINTVDSTTDGHYTCIATNEAGVAEKDFLVKYQGPPIIENGQESTVLKVGDSATITCNILANGLYNMTWKSSEGGFLSTSDYGSNFEVVLNEIKITNARLSDAGTFVCVAQNEAGISEKEFEISVIESPRFLDTETNYPIIIDKPLVLNCNATGSPKPTIIWMKNGHRINETRGVFSKDRFELRFDLAKDEDAGRYTCMAENKAGREEKDLLVEILQPPKVPGTLSTIEVLKGEPLTLHCSVIEGANVEFSWTKNGVPVTTSDRVQLSTNRDKLYIMGANATDGAEYRCIVENEAGKDEMIFVTTIIAAPTIIGPAFGRQNVIKNQTVELVCEAYGTPAPDILWTFDGHPLLVSPYHQLVDDNKKLIITAIQEEHEGRYTCQAFNKAGQTEIDNYIEVTAPPQALMTTEEIKVVAGRSTTIRCEVFGNPLPTVQWVKNGLPFNSDLLQSATNLKYFHLREATIEDAGRYTCIAANRAGEDKSTTILTVLVAPVIDDGERLIQAKEGNNFVIDCPASGVPAPTFSWRKNGKPIENAETSRLEFSSATLDDRGRYTCMARNEAGHATADFAVDIHTRPVFEKNMTDVRTTEEKSAKLECKVTGSPTPTIRWLKGGREITDMSNFLISPRGETLMIVKARRSDSGSYSCVAKNAAGESEASFIVTVMIAPYIDEYINQNPKVVAGDSLELHCPAKGNPKPTVTWSNGTHDLKMEDNYYLKDDTNLVIRNASHIHNGRFVCTASNEAGVMHTEFETEVIAKPKFEREGEIIFEVVEGRSITMDCQVENSKKIDIMWYRGDNPVFTEGVSISKDGMQMTIKSAKLADGGKYTCKASNQAGSADIDMILKVLVPPSIDKSNIIGNPLALATRDIYLECPVTGIPQPRVIWTKDGKEVNASDSRLIFLHNNETLGIEGVLSSDEGRYTCTATNKGGIADQDFQLEVLTPPMMDLKDNQEQTKREGDTVTLICPVKNSVDISDAVYDVTWQKDGYTINRDNQTNIEISNDGRRLTVTSSSITNAGKYTCIAMNRAGESSIDFRVEILSPPVIDQSKNDVTPQVALNNPIILYCPVSGHPFPLVKWLKEGKPIEQNDEIKILDEGQAIQIINSGKEHAGKWTCVAENDAGVKEHEINLDVWVPPTVTVTSEAPIKNLGETITLICNASGNPTPSLKWTKGGQQIYTTPEGARVSLKGTRLDIPHLKKDDVGSYTCHAANDAGSNEASIDIDVLVPPEINRNNIDMSPRLPTGQTLTLICNVEGKPEPEIKWLINKTEITSNNKRVVSENQNKMITVSNVTLEDRGLYECYAINVAGNDTVMYNVKIVHPPTIANGGTRQVIEGETAKIDCVVEGYPAPLVSWLRNGIRVETGVQGVRYIAEGETLTVHEARSSDSGIYVCAATNEAGTAQQAYTLEVLVSPKIVSSGATEMSYPAGTAFKLPCGVRGYPEPDIIWSLNGKVVDENTPGIEIDDEGTLIVKAAEGRNLAYECTAKNDAGTDTIEYKIHTISAPKIGKSGKRYVNGSEGEPVELTCDIEGDDSQITWNKNGVLLLPTSNVKMDQAAKTLSIGVARLSDQGEYTCNAVNKAGNATQSTSLNIGIPPTIMDRKSPEIVKRGETVTLWCEAAGVPRPTIEWYKDGVLIQQTGTDDSGDTIKKSAVFSSVQPSDAGFYTCHATNWAGTVEQEVELFVMIPPEISPEKMNVTTDPRQTVFLTCNATGIPEPIISWVRDPNTPIQASQKYQLLGTTLAIRNILPQDEGFYHCIARSDAGQKIASRKLIVNQPTDKPLWIWADCDENGKPKKIEYMMDRGDSPDDKPLWLPWKEVQDETLNVSVISYRCMPGPRMSRTVLLHNAPVFVVTPKNYTVSPGAVVELKCSATGPPNPFISWAKNDQAIESVQKNMAFNYLKLHINSTADAGNYTCIAQNSVGISTATAYIEVNEHLKPTSEPLVNRKVAVITCYEKNIAYNRGVTWEYQGRPLQKNLAGIHFMNNGSLVILDAGNISQEELDKYTCKVRNRRRFSSATLSNEIERMPSVKTADEINVISGEPVILDCVVNSNALTTNVIWTKNDQKLMSDEITSILPNNSLLISRTETYDDGIYKCVASNSIGKAYDDVKLNVIGSGGDSSTAAPTTTTTTTTTTSPPSSVSVFVEGSGDENSIRFQMTTPSSDQSQISEQEPNYVYHDNLREKSKTVTRIIDTTDCDNGFTDDQGNCIEFANTKNKQVASDDACPDGYAVNAENGICEDIDECSFDQPCDYECENTEGSYECFCPSGYDMLEDTCVDINECNMIACNEDQACFNTLGGYQCIKDPCPANYTLVNDKYCEPICETCGDTPITVHMLSIPSGLSVSHIATLTAYDKEGKVVTDTKYSISETTEGLDQEKTRAGPFAIKGVRGGNAQVWTNKVLAAGSQHSVRVRAKSDNSNAPKETNFLVLINVGQYPF